MPVECESWYLPICLQNLAGDSSESNVHSLNSCLKVLIMNDSILIDVKIIDDYISDRGITQEAFCGEAGVATKTFYRARTERIDIGSAEKIAKAAGLHLEDIIAVDEKTRSQAKEISRILMCIAYLALVEFVRVINRPDMISGAGDTDNVVNVNEAEGEKGSKIDKHLSSFFIKHAKAAFNYPDSPFKTGGLHIWEEERLPERILGTSGRIDFVFTGDSVDDSSMAEARLGGQGVFAVHHRKHGLLACVVVDYARKLLYSATPFSNTTYLRISNLSQDIDLGVSTSIPDGSPPQFSGPSVRAKLEGARINCFLGKSARLKEVNQYLGKLLDEKISWFPYGGARGPCLTADGTVDASIETLKGMRYLDAVPSLLLVQQAGGVCIDPDTGKRILLNDSKDLFEALDKADMDRLSNLRKKFIAAGNMRLARLIRSHCKEE